MSTESMYYVFDECLRAASVVVHLAINVGYILAIYPRQSVVHVREMYISLHCMLLSDILSMEGSLIMQYVVPITQPNWLDSRAESPVDQVICALNEARADDC